MKTFKFLLIFGTLSLNAYAENKVITHYEIISDGQVKCECHIGRCGWKVCTGDCPHGGHGGDHLIEDPLNAGPTEQLIMCPI